MRYRCLLWLPSWHLPPLSGLFCTRTNPDLQEFIKRTGDFAVMIGLSLHGKSVLGVVHAPAQQTPKTYYAVADKGSFVLAGGEDQCGEGLEGSERVR